MTLSRAERLAEARKEYWEKAEAWGKLGREVDEAARKLRAIEEEK